MVHTLTKQEVLKLFDVNEKDGLSDYEVKKRQKQYGRNDLTIHKKKTIVSLFINQMMDPMVFVLFISIFLSVILKEYIDAGIILSVILLNAIFGIVQEYQAEKTMQVLQQMTIPTTIVKRNGTYLTIASSEVTVGDIVLLEAGKYISCDMRLLSCNELSVDESSFTGESDAVSKNDAFVYNEDTHLADRKNMVYASTYVVSGKAEGVVVAIGMMSEVGKIAGLLQEVTMELTPLQLRYQKLGKWLGYLTMIIAISMIMIGYFQQRELLSLIMTAISLAVAAIPEGLAAVITVILSFGIQRMSREKTIVRKMQTVETLGSVDTICTDKTGTLTKNQLEVMHLGFPVRNVPLPSFLEAICICNDCIEEKEDYQQNAIDLALLKYAETFQVNKYEVEKRYPRVYEIPFQSSSKRMVTVIRKNRIYEAYMKGAWEIVLEQANKIDIDGVIKPLSQEIVQRIEAEAKQMANQSLRIIAIARKEILSLEHQNYNDGYIFMGLIGMKDPPKEGVYEAIAKAQRAGIHVIMITGDHPQTALAIAKELQIAQYPHEVLTGNEINLLSDEAIAKQLQHTKVYARVSPEHKMRIVQFYKKQGNIVAMTGDGVNDAPALKHANVGIAMGKKGTDVCKEASDMVIMDDEFRTIVVAIEEGRGIYRNIQKVITYLLSCNLGEVVSIFAAILLLPGMPLPLHPIQILWINLITDTFPAFALGMEPKDVNLMHEQPYHQNTFMNKQQIIDMVFNGMLIGMMTVIAYKYGLQYSLAVGQTMAFITLAITQLFHTFNLRSMDHSIFKVGLFKNKVLNVVAIGSMFLQFLVCELPFFQQILHVVSIPVNAWILIIGQSLFIIMMNEGIKIFRKTDNM